MYLRGNRSLIWCALIFLLFACDGPPPNVETLEGVSIGGSSAQVLSAPLWIADEKGYFEENGLEVELKGYSAGSEAVKALIHGEVDLATMSEFVVVDQIFQGQDLMVVCSIAKANIQEIIATTDLGIQTISDLKGKKIGIKVGSSSEFFLGRALVYHGLSIHDVELSPLKPSQMDEAIKNREVAAVITWYPHVNRVKSGLGALAVSWPAQGETMIHWTLTGRKDWLHEHGHIVENLLASLLRSEAFLESRQAAAKDLLKKRLDLETEYLEIVWPMHRFSVELPQAMLLTMEEETRWKIENHLTDQREVPNYLNCLYLEGLEAVSPESVTVIR